MRRIKLTNARQGLGLSAAFRLLSTTGSKRAEPTMTSSLVKKLGIREGSRLALVDAPEHFVALARRSARRRDGAPRGPRTGRCASRLLRLARPPRASAPRPPCRARPRWRTLDRLAEASLGRGHRCDGGRRPRTRTCRGSRGQQDLRNRRDLVGASLRVPARRPFLLTLQRKLTRLLPRANPA